MGNWFEELKRRNVFRVALAYLVASWLILQVADVVLGNIEAPEWVMQTLMFLLAIGLLLAITFSWIYELTPEGLKRESEIDPERSITSSTGQKLNRLTVGLLVLVLAVVGIQAISTNEPQTSTAGDSQAGNDSPSAEETAASDANAAPAREPHEKSIAVLAFADLSPDSDQAYFAEGIAEELLNVLAQVPGLKVAGRTSSFAFKDQNRDLREIGEILDVAHILEGSVRTQGNKVRVTAQLIKADDGFHLFSETYDGDLTDIFQVQDDIAEEIAVALKATILGDSPVAKFAETDPVVYENYLKARQWIHTRNLGLMERALVVLDEALDIDPDYAPALAQKATALMLLSNSGSSYGDIPLDEAMATARPLIDRALAIDPNLAEGWAVSGLWRSYDELNSSPAAIADLRKALAINPSLTNAINWLAIGLPADTGRAETIALYETAMEHDPLYRPAFNNLVVAYLETRQIDAAKALIQRVERVAGESPLVQLAYGMLELAQGSLAAAYAPLERAWDYNPRASVASAQFGNLLVMLGEYEKASGVLMRKQRLLPLQFLDLEDEALTEFEPEATGHLEIGDVWNMGDWLLAYGRTDALLELMASEFGADHDWVDNLPIPLDLWGAPVLTNAAYALLDTGQQDPARRVLRVTRQTLDTQRTLGANNFGYWLSEAEYAALTGDEDAMYDSLDNAVNVGFVSLPGFWQATFDRFRSDSRFAELEKRCKDRAIEEREKLGLPRKLIT